MEYQLAGDERSHVVRFRGELGFADMEACQPIMAAFKTVTAERFVVDLAMLDFIDSSGLGVLVSIRNSAVRRGAAFVIKGARGEVASVLKMTRFDVLAIFED
jgi:anti-anti-sigma factor